MTIRFAAIGINHDHIYGQVDCLLRAGRRARRLSCRRGRSRRSPSRRTIRRRSASPTGARILEDHSIALVVTAGDPRRPRAARRRGHAPRQGLHERQAGHDHARPAGRGTPRAGGDRAHLLGLLLRAFRDALDRARPASWCTPGAIGKVDQHRRPRAAPAQQAAAPGLVLRARAATAASSPTSPRIRCEQFLFFTGAIDAEVVAAHGRQPRPIRTRPGCRISATCCCDADDATGYVRVDWFTPDGLPTWGDGRLIILGTEGYIELRKYIDIAGQPGTDHLFLVDQKGVAAASTARDVELPYGRQLIADVLDRTETAMPQARCFKAMELALTAQAMAEGTEDGSAGDLLPAKQHRASWRMNLRIHKNVEKRRIMSKVCNVAVVGLRIGRSHIAEGYRDQSRATIRCWRSATSIAGAPQCVGGRVRHRAPDHLLRRPAGDARHRHRRYLHAAGPARPAGPGRAARRQARDLRKAARRLARRCRRSSTAAEKRVRPAASCRSSSIASATASEGEAHHRRAALPASPISQRSRPLWQRDGGILRGAVARQMGDRARRRAGHPRHPPARHADLSDGRRRIGVRPHGDARQRDRGRGLRRRQPRAWRAARSRPLAATLGSQNEISRLRFCFEHVTFESSLEPYRPGNDPWKIMPASPKSQRRIDDALAGWTPSHRASRGLMQRLPRRPRDAAAPLPVTLADARRSLELITALYPFVRDRRGRRPADRPRPSEICELAASAS